MKKRNMIIAAVVFVIIAALSLYAVTSRADTLPVELTLKQKLVAAEAVVAVVTGPIILPVALATGNGEALCKQLEGAWVKPTSYDPNSDGRDQCPKGNWLRIIPVIKDYITE